MNRDVLFRGKRIDNGEWVYGYVVLLKDESGSDTYYIYTGSLHDGGLYKVAERYEVVPYTICRYVLLKDKNCNMIFENDTVRQAADVDNDGVILYFYYKIIWDENYARFKGVDLNSNEEFLFEDLEDIEVIGNIFDNPDLIGGD